MAGWISDVNLLLDFCNKLELESLTFIRPNGAFNLYFRCMYGILCFIGTFPRWMGFNRRVKLERLTANAEVATVLGSISASSDTLESEWRQIKQCWIK